ncbi:MAG: hypothetical protein PHG66_02425 [Candidatus Colwellbacteria bacterium]|nr:hypothetical protein [Candidatus Colwellbacteria bacterium]
MAIIIQEEEKKSNIVVIGIAGAILIVAGVMTYYVFFSPVPLVEQIGNTSDKYQSVSKLAGANVDVEKITESSVWKSLNRTGSMPTLTPQLPSRRSNPFEAF